MQAKEITERLEAQRRQGLDLEAEFWNRFLPGCIHYKTGKPLALYPYQIEALRQIWRNERVILHWGRQCGKTMVVALYLAFMSRWLPNAQVLILSFGGKQSRLMLRDVRFFLKRHQDRSYAGNIQLSSSGNLTFKNDSTIDAMPSGQGSRGFTADVFIMDECELVAEDDLTAHLPTKLTTEGRTVLLGTSFSTDGFWYDWTCKPGEFGFAYSKITSVDAQAPNGPVRVKTLADLRRELGSDRFNRECLLLPLSSDLRWFPQALVTKVFPAEALMSLSFQPGITLSVGVDPATSSKDESVAYPLWRLGNTIHELAPVMAWHGTPAPVQVQALKLWAEKLGPYHPFFVVDRTSAFGITFCDLAEAAGLKIRPFTFTSQSKALLFTKGKTTLEDLSVKLQDQATKHQLSVYQFRESEQVRGRFRFGERNVPDDRVDALMLSLWGLQQPEKIHGHPSLFDSPRW